ncbi:MAG TPA: autotransporter domain-containing protein [Chlamydiales bacterium]|nr:autotransporter domain-containing protein [Chlamydiales bacterium]
MRIQKLLVALYALSLPIAGYTCATPSTWVGPFNTNWSVSTSWSNLCVPGANPTVTNDTAIITTNQETIQNLGPIQLLSVQFQGSSGQVGTINNGGSNTISFNDPGANITILSSTSYIGQFLGGVIFNTDTALSINGSNNQLLIPVNTINSATLTYANLGGTGNFIRFNNLTLTSSTLQSQNNIAHTGAIGNNLQLTLTSAASINTGGNLKNQNQSSGAIHNTNGIGTTIAVSNTANPNLTLNGGSILNENAGTIGAGAGAKGAQLIFNNATTVVGLSVTSGTVTNSNTGNVTGAVGTPSFGSLMIFGVPTIPARTVSFNISGGTVTNNNTGTVTNGFGSLIQVVNTSAAINIGSPGGTLINNDTVQGHVNITTGGTMSGIGLYTGFNNTTPGPATATVINNTSGNVHPDDGNDPGTMTINGTYTQGASGTYTADLLNATTFSKLNVLGTANIAGNLVVDFLPGNTVSASNTFTLLQATTLAGSQFTTTYQNLPSTLIPTVTYTFGPNGTVVLSFTLAPTPPPSVTIPTSYAGGFMDTVLSGINHINSHITLRMEDLRRRFRASKDGNAIVRNRSRSENLIASSDNQFLALNPELREKQELQRREITSENTKPWSFYFGPIGRAFGEIHGRDEQPGARFWSVGGLAGFDYAFSQVGVGLLADYERIYNHVKEHWGRITVDEFQASAYATYAPECLPELAIYGIAGGAYELYHFRRNTTSAVAKGKPHGFAYDGLIGIEYALGMCNFHFIPLANAQYIYVRAESYNEHGAGSFDMNVRSQHIKSLRSSLGFRLNYYYEVCNFKFIPEIYGEWQREYLNRQRHVGITPLIAGVAGGTLLMPGSGRNIVLGGIDLLLTMYDRFELEANYETEYNSRYHDHFFYVGAAFRF